MLYPYIPAIVENVLIDSEGYTVIVDFGFAKYVSDKTYTRKFQATLSEFLLAFQRAC